MICHVSYVEVVKAENKMAIALSVLKCVGVGEKEGLSTNQTDLKWNQLKVTVQYVSKKDPHFPCKTILGNFLQYHLCPASCKMDTHAQILIKHLVKYIQ